MSNSRMDLQALLESIPGLAYDSRLDGPAVYFQPPPSVMMVYPCIRYSLDGGETIHADDRPYIGTPRYSVYVIDPDPDSKVRDAVWNLLGMRFDRAYTADNLNHYAFTIYY